MFIGKIRIYLLWVIALFSKRNNNVDKKFRAPRIWSNLELSKFSGLFFKDVVNVSGWKDSDKEGKHYRDYFANARSYSITNFNSENDGYQGQDGEIFLDLEKKLPSTLEQKFEVVFNHTTLEHIYEFRKAFFNICLMSNEVVIIVVPYIQQMHGIAYSDYWRFTPHAMKRMFEENGFVLQYCSANGSDTSSIYLFCIGLRSSKYSMNIPARFDIKLDEKIELYGTDNTNVIGGHVVKNGR